MKKNIITGILLITLCSITLIGCNKKDEGIPEETEVISVKIDSTIPNITELSKSEILSLTSEDVRKSVETYLPAYRTIYKIDKDRVMSEDDWLTLRDIICIQFYGNADLENFDSVDELEDKNDIYYNPNKESIKKMSIKEFAVYLNGLYTYLYGDDYLETHNIDFTTYEESTILQLKQDYLETITN